MKIKQPTNESKRRFIRLLGKGGLFAAGAATGAAAFTAVKWPSQPLVNIVLNDDTEAPKASEHPINLAQETSLTPSREYMPYEQALEKWNSFTHKKPKGTKMGYKERVAAQCWVNNEAPYSSIVSPSVFSRNYPHVTERQKRIDKVEAENLISICEIVGTDGSGNSSRVIGHIIAPQEYGAEFPSKKELYSHISKLEGWAQEA